MEKFSTTEQNFDRNDQIDPQTQEKLTIKKTIETPEVENSITSIQTLRSAQIDSNNFHLMQENMNSLLHTHQRTAELKSLIQA